MGYIYCIENKVNNKMYVGKTIHTVEQRWAEHKRDVSRLRRPLYLAIRKYGIDNSTIKELEQCSDDIIEEREKYWIKELGTFHNGYNMTLGGDGTEYFDHTDQEVIDKYNELWSVRKVADYFNCDTDTISTRLRRNNINPKELVNRNLGQQVKMSDPKHIVEDRIFENHGDAARWLIANHYSSAQVESIRANIGRCVKGTRSTCCGFMWEKV